MFYVLNGSYSLLNIFNQVREFGRKYVHKKIKKKFKLSKDGIVLHTIFDLR